MRDRSAQDAPARFSSSSTCATTFLSLSFYFAATLFRWIIPSFTSYFFFFFLFHLYIYYISTNELSFYILRIRVNTCVIVYVYAYAQKVHVKIEKKLGMFFARINRVPSRAWITQKVYSLSSFRTTNNCSRSICLFIYLSIYLSICIYISIYLSIFLSIYLSISSSIYPSIHLSIHPSNPSIHPSTLPLLHRARSTSMLEGN